MFVERSLQREDANDGHVGGFCFQLEKCDFGSSKFLPFCIIAVEREWCVWPLYLINGNVELKCNDFQFLCICLLFV